LKSIVLLELALKKTCLKSLDFISRRINLLAENE